MTVNSETNKVIVLGNASATSFSFSPMAVYSTDELEVRTINSSGVLSARLTEGTGTSNYSVVLNSGLAPGQPRSGTVTYPASGTDNVLASGEKLVIRRLPSFSQSTELDNLGGYLPEVQETQFDELTFQTQYLKELADRALKHPVDVSSSVSRFLPAPEAGKVLGWNASGLALVNLDAGTGEGGGTDPDPEDPPTIAGTLLLDDGEEDAPSYSFTHSSNSGWYWDDTNDTLVASVEGQNRVKIDDSNTIDLLTVGPQDFSAVRIEGSSSQTKRLVLQGDTVEPSLEAESNDGSASSIAIRASGIDARVDFKGKTPFGVQATEHGISHTVGEDQTEDLETLMNDLSDQGGGTVLFEQGDYYFTTACSIPSNIHIKGEGKVRFMLGKLGVLRTDGNWMFDDSQNNVQIRSTVSSAATVWPINISVSGGDISRFAVGTKWRVRGAGGGGIEVRDDQDLTVASTDGVDDVTMVQPANATYLVSWDTGTYPEAAAYVAKYGGTDLTLLSPFVMQLVNASIPKGQQWARIPTTAAANFPVGEAFILSDDTIESDIAGSLRNKTNVQVVRIAKSTNEGANVTKLHFTAPALRAYSSTKGAALFRMVWVENVKIENIEFVKYEAPNASPASRVPALELRFCKNTWAINCKCDGNDSSFSSIRGNMFRTYHSYDSGFRNCYGAQPGQSGSGDGYIFALYYSTGGGCFQCYAEGGRHNFISQGSSSYKFVECTSRNALISDVDSHGVNDVDFEWGNITILQSELRSSDSNTSVAGCRIGNTSHPGGSTDGLIHDILIFGSGSSESRAIDVALPANNIKIDNVYAFNIYDGFYTRSSSLADTLVADTVVASNLHFQNIGRYGIALLGDADTYTGYQLKNFRFSDIYSAGGTANTAVRAIQVDGLSLLDIEQRGDGSTAATSFYFDDIVELVVDGVVGNDTYRGFSVTDCVSAYVRGGPFTVNSSGYMLVDNGGCTGMEFSVAPRAGSNPYVTDAGSGPSTQRVIQLPGRRFGKVFDDTAYTFLREDLSNFVLVNGDSGNGSTTLTIPLTILRSTETSAAATEKIREVGVLNVVSIGTAEVLIAGATDVTVVLPAGFTSLSTGQSASIVVVRTGAATLTAYVTTGGTSGSEVVDTTITNSSESVYITGSTYTVDAFDRALFTDTLDVTDHVNIVRNATPANAVAITMPTSSTVTAAGRYFVFVQDTDQTGLVTIEPASGGTIDGGTSAITMAGPGAMVSILVVANAGSAPEMLSFGSTRSDVTHYGTHTFTGDVVVGDDVTITDDVAIGGDLAVTGTTTLGPGAITISASGWRIAQNLVGVAPATAGADSTGVRVGGSAQAENVIKGWAFDPTTDELVDFIFVCHSYFPTGKGLNVKFSIVTDATSGNCVFQAAFRRLDAAEDVDTSQTYTSQTSGAIAVPATAGCLKTITIPFTSSQIDGLLAGEPCILRLRRDADNTSATDSVTGNDILVVEKTVIIEIA